MADLSEYAHLLAAKSGGKLKKFYGYLIGDTVNPLRLNGWTSFPVGKGWFQSNSLSDPYTHRALGETYFEILYFSDVIARAKQRIGIYQDKLKLNLQRDDLLCDYKVIVLAVEEAHVNRRIQNLLKDPDNQLKVDDAAKIIGCWKALSKQGLADDLVGDVQAMQRAVAFCQVIEIAKAGKTHKVSSKQITKPVFDALFEGYSFAQNNPMSQAMQAVLEVLQEHHLSKEADTLQSFYDSVKMRAEGIENAEGKQRIIKELYDKFFNGAFPTLAKRLGIVYTPVEVVDFIIHSVSHILQAEFGQTLGGKGVHILDPFTGTGTFITRLLQSGLIAPEQVPYKFQNEIHANEIVLLAYYIAAINIEAVCHSIVGGDYRPFEGICLCEPNFFGCGNSFLRSRDQIVGGLQPKSAATTITSTCAAFGKSSNSVRSFFRIDCLSSFICGVSR